MHRFLVLLLFFAYQTNAQDTAQNFDPPAQPVRVRAVETFDPIRVDGKLDEAAWGQAIPIQDFFRMEPRQGGEYRFPTTVRVLFDRKNLYFGVFCKDSLGRKGVRVQDLRRDFQYGDNDIFYLQLDPQNLKRYCVSFQTTPYGNQRDLQVFDDSFRDNDWDALWSVRTMRTDSGYFAEFAIPFKSLRYDRADSPADSVSWGMTLARLARRDYEVTSFPAVPQAFTAYRMSYAAQLTGLKIPPPSLNLRVQPYLLVQSDRARVNDGPWQGLQSSARMGGEVKWAVNTHAVADFTFNTDFAQADVDRAVNNLTRFNLFFPERRQFFLENRGVYAGANAEGINPFFSRSIGLADAQFNADPVPIDAGVRYTDRTAQRTFAGLLLRQRATEFQGAGNFGVLRYLKNYGEQNNVGAMVTHRYDEENPESGFAQNNNTTVTVDGFARSKDNSWSVQYMASASLDSQIDRPGYSMYFFAGRFLPKWYYGWVSKYVDANYKPGMGFVFGNDVVHHNPGGYRIIRPKGKLGKLIRRWDPGVFVNYYQNARDGRFQSADLNIFPIYFIFQSGALLTGSIYPTWEHFFFQPLGIDIKPDRYYFTRYEIKYNTDQSKKLAASISHNFGKYYDGKLNDFSASLRFAPIPHVAFTADYRYNGIRRLGIDREDQDIHLYSAGLRLAVNPRIQLTSFYQYNSFDNRTRVNLRGSWEFLPLSFLYLVYNSNQNTLDRTSLRSDQAIAKLTYLKQF